jgi:hypothetical protein
MRRLAAASFACVLAAAPVAARADLFSSLSYGVHASTIGDGITLEKPLLYDFSVRVTTGTASVSQQLSYDGNPYLSTAKFRNVGVIADYRPGASRYRISGGLVFGNDSILNVARDNGAGAIRVGNAFYPVSQIGKITTRLTFPNPSVYLGVGTGTGLIRGFTLAFDAGILVRNGIASSSSTGALQNDPAFRADLLRTQSELRTHLVVPVLSLGLTFRP